MGTRLIARGIAPSEVWRAPLDHPDLVAEIHQSYAGADAITAATFGLAMHADEDVAEIAAAALKLARDAAGERPVIASLGPGEPERIVPSLADADIVLLETFTSLADLQHALERCDFDGPRWATLCFLGDTTTDGASPEDAARRLDADHIGINCGEGLESARLALRMFGQRPVIARPSAGVETQATPEQFALLAAKLFDEGVAIVGGCCGVHAEHITAAVDVGIAAR